MIGRIANAALGVALLTLIGTAGLALWLNLFWPEHPLLEAARPTVPASRAKLCDLVGEDDHSAMRWFNCDRVPR